MAIFIVTLMIMAIGIAMLSIRIIAKENGEFHGTCSTRNVSHGGQLDSGCVCGRRPGEPCPNEDGKPDDDQPGEK